MSDDRLKLTAELVKTREGRALIAVRGSGALSGMLYVDVGYVGELLDLLNGAGLHWTNSDSGYRVRNGRTENEMASEPNDGGPAFPAIGTHDHGGHRHMGPDGSLVNIMPIPYPGMSYRRYLAAAALKGSLANKDVVEMNRIYWKVHAGEMWDWADAMLATEHPQQPAQQPETAPDATISGSAAGNTSETGRA
jgi:hypothetical protein